MDHLVCDKNKDISIRLLSDGVSFSIQNEAGKTIVPLQIIKNTGQKGSEAIKEAILSSGILEESYKNIKIVVPSLYSTFIPEKDFNSQHIKEYYQAIIGLPEDELLITNHIEEIHSYNLFSLKETIYDFLIRSFINPTILHHTTPLLQLIMAKLPNNGGKMMVIRYDVQLLTIIAFNHKELMFINTFPCNSIENALYFILSGWKLFEFDQLNDELLIIKDNIFEEELLRKVSQYVKKSTLLLLNTEDL